MANESVISTLNNLIETCKDGQEGFQQAAEGVQDSSLKTLFYEYSQQRAQFVGELQGLVRELGGDAETSSSIAGALHRGWINIKSAVTGRDDAAILNECERGEDVAKNAYKDALAADLPTNVSSVIQRQATGVQQAHDRIRSLRDSANNASSSTATGG
ncbi:MAG: PA2169 family four-helix-bundle protein [Acidobacteriota bacterium]|nr:PA2169 family four-helix-bundle protein [Acidobacteriota bacterium]